MGTVIKFPTKRDAAKSAALALPAREIAAPPPAPFLKAERTYSIGFKVKAIPILLLKGIWASVWLVLVSAWPMVRWIAGIDLCFQLIRTAYFWNTPNVYAGWTFLLHFAVFSALTYLVGVHRPAGFRDLAPVRPAASKA
jgi:hypothetical protein